MSELDILPKDKNNHTKAVIKAAAAGITIAGAVIAPNLPLLLSKLIDNNITSDKTLRAIRYAKTNGWLTFEETSQGVEIALSASGKLKWITIELDRPLQDKVWDKQWRLVLFDIPIRLKANADTFRAHLKRLGLQQLQRSIWITPYRCETQIAVLRQIYTIKPHVRIIEAHAIENEASLKRSFNLT